ncbi:MAG: hypothetical protein P4L79_08780 [Legionella sp.]|uniref:hypothetical protein n=1 Tax=Legionella sp. TaxID=459 RepID=UPI00284C447F|nr:hypothetical protein [Legionella sp.]
MRHSDNLTFEQVRAKIDEYFESKFGRIPEPLRVDGSPEAYYKELIKLITHRVYRSNTTGWRKKIVYEVCFPWLKDMDFPAMIKTHDNFVNYLASPGNFLTKLPLGLNFLKLLDSYQRGGDRFFPYTPFMLWADCFSDLASCYDESSDDFVLIDGLLNELFLSIFFLPTSIQKETFIENVNQYKSSAIYQFDFDEILSQLANVYDNTCFANKDERKLVLSHHDKFIQAIISLRATYFDQLNSDSTKKPGMDASISQLAILLEEIRFHPKQDVALQNFKKYYNDGGSDSLPKSFFKALGAVILAGLCYISLIGAVKLHNQESTPIKWAKDICGVNPNNTAWRCLTFRPEPIISTVDKFLKLVPVEQEHLREERSICK